jgi:hypothetical protein
MVNGVMNKIRHIVFRNQFDLFILVIVLLAIMIRWIVVFNEEAKAPPIVIDNTLKKQDLESKLLTLYNETDPVQNDAGVTKTNFQNSGSLGNTGYAPSGLGQPCTAESSTYKSANLPKSNTIQKCKENEGLECVSGIYQGSICLKYVNQSCELRSDCSPDAPLCINQLCQPQGEVINTPCSSDTDCKGDLGNLNHVCDPVSKLCVFDIWPKDSGCTNASQCLYDKANPGKISCLTSGDQDGYLLSFGSCYSGTSLVVQGADNYQYFTKGTYVIVYESDPKVYAGRYLIDSGTSSPSSKTTLVVLESSFENTIKPTQGSQYTLDFGTKRDGICVINTPEGAIPETIPGTDEKYPCDSGTKLSKSGYCLLPGRVENKGTSEDICIYDTNISCESGLCCTYDQNTVNSFKGIVDGAYTITNTNGVQQISGNDIKNIGRCRNQLRELYQTCQNNCVKEYVCLTETDINDNTFSYCGNEWDIMNDRSDLNDCPDGFQLDEDTLLCKSSKNKFCFNTSNCVSGTTCSQTNTGLLFDPYTQSYTYPAHMKIPDSLLPPAGTQLNLLVSSSSLTKDPTLIDNHYTNPIFFGFYYQENSTTWKIPFQIFGGNPNFFNYNNVITVTFEDTIIGDPEFSAFLLDDGTVQFNCSYVLEYQNTRKRLFMSDSYGQPNLYFSGLKNGTSVFFEDYPGVYTLDFSSGNISFPGTTDTMNLVNVIDSEGGVCSMTNFGQTPVMITYDSRYTANNNSDYFIIQDGSTILQTGDEFSYVSESGSSIFFVDNDGNNQNLSSEKTYYSSVIRYPNPDTTAFENQIFLTEDYGSKNSNPYLKNQYIDTPNLRTEVASGTYDFEGDNSYIQTKPLYGVNVFSITLPQLETTSYTIPSRKEYINIGSATNPGFAVFNSPVGYLSDTSNIRTEISQENIFVTYEYGEGLNQTVKLSYTINSPENFSQNKENIYYSASSGMIGLFPEEVIQYSFDNSFRAPIPSIPYQTEDVVPYKIDRVRPFEDDNISSDTVKFLTTYKEINPGNIRTDVADISILRKIETDATGSGEILAFQYKGISPSGTDNLNFFNSSGVFGYASGIPLFPIEDSLLATNNGNNNVFVGGTNTIVFNNQNDIDVILKYGSSDLVIGYNDSNNAIIITKINNYDVGLSGIQTLNVEINVLLDSSEKILNPILYVNNIYPINTIGSTISDGRNIFTSCVSPNSVPSFSFSETSYNIVHALPYLYSNYYSFSPFYIFKTSNLPETQAPTEPSYVVSSSTIDELILKFEKNDYSLTVTADSAIGVLPGYLTVCNSKFLSTYLDTVTVNSQPGGTAYMGGAIVSNNFSLISKYINLSSSEQLKNIGSIMTKENTFPFYTPGLKNYGSLDESYLSKLKWPYWIKNLNTGSLKVNKIYLNWDPGNMENNMFYYANVEISGVSMLLYLSPNFIVNSIKESEPVPIYLNSGEEDSQFHMLPENKNLVILSGLCRAN